MPHLEHIGIAVDDPAAVARLYEHLLDRPPYKRERVDREGVQTHFLSAETVKLELLEALGPDSPVGRYLQKRGEGLHHLAFEVGDIHAQMQRVRALGLTPLSDTPRPGADGKQIFFLHPKETHGVLIEFCQSVPTPLPATPIPCGDGHLAAYALGDAGAPPLVVLHSLAGATMLDTEPLAHHLEQQFHVLALDLAGHGGSDAFTELPFSLDFFADNVRCLLDTLAVEKAHLFGFSTGGTVALRFAHLHPDRVDRLVLHSTPVAWDPALAAALKTRLDADRLATQAPALTTRLAEAHSDWQSLFARARHFVDTLSTHDETQHHLDHITHPVLVSTVDQDDLLPLEASLALHGALPHSRLALLPGRRHALDGLDFAVYARLLTRYLRGK